MKSLLPQPEHGNLPVILIYIQLHQSQNGSINSYFQTLYTNTIIWNPYTNQLIYFLCQQIRTVEKFEDNTGIIRNHQSKQDRQYNGEQKKDKHLHCKLRLCNTNSTNTGVFLKDERFLLYQWHPSCFSAIIPRKDEYIFLVLDQHSLINCYSVRSLKQQHLHG